MYEEWCDECEKPMKCHNHRGQLYCIECKTELGPAPGNGYTR
jgi:primosomal protein N'